MPPPASNPWHATHFLEIFCPLSIFALTKRAVIGSITTAFTSFDLVEEPSGTSIGYAFVTSVTGLTRKFPIFPKTIINNTPRSTAAAILLNLRASINLPIKNY